MKQRTITAIIMIIVFVPIVIIQNEVFITLFQILMLALLLISVFEMMQMYSKKKPFSKTMKVIIFISTIIVYLSALKKPVFPDSYLPEYMSILGLNVEFLPVFSGITLVLFASMVFSHHFDGVDIGKAWTIIIYCGLGFSSVTSLRMFGIRIIVYLLLVTTLTDTFAYFVGVKFGKHKMAPTISPKKSWEGAIGGTIIASIIATIYAMYYGDLFASAFGPVGAQTIFDGFIVTDFSFTQGFILVLVISVLTSISGQIGDLVASKFKRTYDIKDFGKILPGHGGILDRFDSAIFASMFLVFLYTLFEGIIIVG